MPEAIGTCEICGATDHHLVEGLCPVCRPKTITLCETARRQGKTFLRQQLAPEDERAPGMYPCEEGDEL